jgi:hypothetical protein
MRSEGAGTLVDSPQAALQGATFEATRRDCPGAERTMHGSIDLSGHQG